MAAHIENVEWVQYNIGRRGGVFGSKEDSVAHRRLKRAWVREKVALLRLVSALEDLVDKERKWNASNARNFMGLEGNGAIAALEVWEQSEELMYEVPGYVYAEVEEGCEEKGSKQNRPVRGLKRSVSDSYIPPRARRIRRWSISEGTQRQAYRALGVMDERTENESTILSNETQIMPNENKEPANTKENCTQNLRAPINYYSFSINHKENDTAHPPPPPLPPPHPGHHRKYNSSGLPPLASPKRLRFSETVTISPERLNYIFADRTILSNTPTKQPHNKHTNRIHRTNPSFNRASPYYKPAGRTWASPAEHVKANTSFYSMSWEDAESIWAVEDRLKCIAGVFLLIWWLKAVAFYGLAPALGGDGSTRSVVRRNGI
ncbi:hypothetical protein CC78DRAFT_591874 [Lojkania enalia]|uniref:Uncharacterized protein n=1 Tax=Lojkania enalia TaxID=147567 RepID=A0A9P4JZX8_9PLEO|nr:hypothetical protein CC78DRAFT_591874 [Didymosphaeria enalia]